MSLINSKPVHRAHLVSADGYVSALCYAKPRAIDLKVASWTNRYDAVTCPKCLTILRRREEQQMTVAYGKGTAR